MARSTYSAPGVYVEEVPSAQQPIAGVGTNTVGFIGIVPNKIQYPEANPDYDPKLAKIAFAIASGSTVRPEELGTFDERIATLNEEIGKLKSKIPTDDKIKKVQDDLDGTVRKIEPLDKKPLEQRTEEEVKQLAQLNKERNALANQLATLRKEKENGDADLKAKQEELAGLQPAKEGKSGPLGVDERSLLKPYILREFDVDSKVKPFETKLCTNFSEYTSRFGPFSADDLDPTKPQGTALYPGHRALTHAVNGFFNNGGTRCFVARINQISDIERAMKSFQSIDAIAIVAVPGFYTPGEAEIIWDELTTHCEICEDRFAILDCPVIGVGDDGEVDLTVLGYDNLDNILPKRNKNAAFYFPYIEVVDPAVQLQDEDPVRKVESQYKGRVHVPPSGHIAGIYARTDEERGVHKAPANVAVRGALNVQYYIGKPKQELLNPQGVNCIRNMNGNITVWGARTIGGDSNGEWKYISVRRFFLFLRESIDEGTQWCVFEPNDPQLWGKIRRNITAFLTNVWRSGALFGLTPEEAFYVKCDAETNPPEVRDLGMVVTEIGVAIVRPAEFVIFRITQSTGPKTS